MLLVAVVVAVDFSRVRASHNVDLLIALALAAVFFDILMFARMRLVPEALTRLDAVFTAVTALNVALILRAVWYAWVPNAGTAWRPNLRGRPLAAIALLLVICNVATVLVREPDDAGYFTNLGAQRFRERGRLPYGDPLLTGTPGAAYGPILYAARPFQLLVDPRSPNATSPAKPLLGDAATYYLPSPLATRLTTLTLHLAGLLALWVAGRRLTATLTSDGHWSHCTAAVRSCSASAASMSSSAGSRSSLTWVPPPSRCSRSRAWGLPCSRE